MFSVQITVDRNLHTDKFINFAVKTIGMDNIT